MLSSSSYGLIQLILSNRVTENANKILGRKILPGSFSVLSHVSLAPCQPGSFCLADALRSPTLHDSLVPTAAAAMAVAAASSGWDYSCEVVTMPKDHGRRLWCDNGTSQALPRVEPMCRRLGHPHPHRHHPRRFPKGVAHALSWPRYPQSCVRRSVATICPASAFCFGALTCLADWQTSSSQAPVLLECCWQLGRFAQGTQRTHR